MLRSLSSTTLGNSWTLWLWNRIVRLWHFARFYAKPFDHYADKDLHPIYKLITVGRENTFCCPIFVHVRHTTLNLNPIIMAKTTWRKFCVFIEHCMLIRKKIIQNVEYSLTFFLYLKKLNVHLNITLYKTIHINLYCALIVIFYIM